MRKKSFLRRVEVGNYYLHFQRLEKECVMSIFFLFVDKRITFFSSSTAHIIRCMGRKKAHCGGEDKGGVSLGGRGDWHYHICIFYVTLDRMVGKNWKI